MPNRNNYIQIQIQNISGDWFTISTTPNSGEMVTRAMDSAHAAYRKKVRAITPDGGVVDMKF